MRKLFIIFFITLSVIVHASDDSKKSSRSTSLIPSWLSYIDLYKELAVSEMFATGIPASITLAQGILESGAGKSSLARQSNNHFGIKCKRHWTGGKVYHTDDAPNECFRSYDNAYDSYKDHSQFLVNNSRYSNLFKLKRTDYKGWAKGLKAAGYATAPDYAHRLIKIIEDYDLHKYDHMHGNSRLYASRYPNAGLIAPIESKKATDTHHKNFKESDRVMINAFQIHSIIKLNNLDAIKTHKGDTFESIAKELGLSARRLYKYNDYPSNSQPREGELIYVEKKKNKGPKGRLYHVAGPNDNMFFISQKYGVRLKSLLKINNMRHIDAPYKGQIVYLRK
ncbi:MAG: glucosaminidase domain-containing protein [Bacteroidales bacterium]